MKMKQLIKETAQDNVLYTLYTAIFNLREHNSIYFSANYTPLQNKLLSEAVAKEIYRIGNSLAKRWRMEDWHTFNRSDEGEDIIYDAPVVFCFLSDVDKDIRTHFIAARSIDSARCIAEDNIGNVFDKHYLETMRLYTETDTPSDIAVAVPQAAGNYRLHRFGGDAFTYDSFDGIWRMN